MDNYNWIPWSRYLLLLEIDNKKTIRLGRFRRSEGLCREAAGLATHKGYEPTIIDTKRNRNVAFAD